MINGWNGLDFNYLHENGDVLIECEDYVPLHLSTYYDAEKRIEFLKQNDIYSKIRKIEEKKRNELIQVEDKIDWNIKDIMDFVQKHNEYKNIIK